MTKTVLITGASSGIGAATAQYFLQKGWNVSATMRTPTQFDWTSHPAVICPRLDVTAPDTIEDAIAKTLSRFGHIDVLVNNAGYALMGAIEGITAEQFDQQFQTNVYGVVSTIKAVLPIFRAQHSGTIINVASIGGRLAFPLTSSYHATKWAIEGLSESLRYELEPFGIRIKIIEPGGIQTDFIHRGSVWAEHPDYCEMTQQMKRISEQMNARLPKPEGVAKAIYGAAIDRSSRLRYSPYGEAYLFLHAILPDRVWRALVTRLMLRSAD